MDFKKNQGPDRHRSHELVVIIQKIIENVNMVQCPRCGLQVNELHPVASDIILKLQATGETGVPQQVCAGCSSDLRKSLASSGGSVLMAQERAKESHRLTMWKSRVQLIKKARAQMNKKLYGDAAISYEKYLKILEIVFDLKKGEILTPTHFRDNARTTEITVVTSVYWDLLRVYDSNEKYADRQTMVAKQLGAFVKFSPIMPDIIRKAEQFQKSAKNPSAVKTFIKVAQSSKGRCFIATAAFESPLAPEVTFLRLYRDDVLKKTYMGRVFVYWYYKFSPFIANQLDKSPTLKKYAKSALTALIERIR